MSDFSKPVLAFDSALGGCVVAVLKDGKAHTAMLETEREQALKLMPMIQEVVAQAGIEFSDIGLIVTTVGPGSFTGLRISLSAARAMGLALSIPVQGVSTLEAMARSAVPEKADCLVVLESKREDFYVQAFDADKNPVGEAACLTPESVISSIKDGQILCGDGLERLILHPSFRAYARNLRLTGEGEDPSHTLGMTMEGDLGISREKKIVDPETLARTGLQRFLDNGQRADRPEPVYLRGADVSLSNKIQREIKDLPV